MAEPRQDGGETFVARWRSRLEAIATSDFVQKVAEMLATRLLLIVTGVLTTVAVARALGPAGRGLYAVAGALGAIGVQLGNLGLHASNTYSVARDRSRLPVLLGNSLLVAIGVGAGGAAVTGIVFLAWPSLAPVHGALLLLALLSVPVGIAYQLLQNLLIGIYEIRLYNRIDLVTKLLALGLVGLALVAGWSTAASFFSFGVAASAVGLVWTAAILRRATSRAIAVSRSTFLETLRYGVKAYLGALFAFIVLRIDLLMVQYMAGSEPTGYYSIAVAMADMLYMIPTVVGTILFPRLAAVGDGEERWKTARRAGWSVGGAMLLLVAAAALLAGPVIRLLFGRVFEPAIPPFLVLLPGIWLISINIVCMNYFAASGMPPITVLSPAVAAVANVLLNLVLIPRMGIVGASISSSLCYGLMLLMSVAYLRRRRRRPVK